MLDTHGEAQRGEATCPGTTAPKLERWKVHPGFGLQRLPAPENQCRRSPFCPGTALDLCPTDAAAEGRDEVGGGSRGARMGEVDKPHSGHLQKLFVKGLEHRSCSRGHGLGGVTASARVAGVRGPMLRQPRASLWPFRPLPSAPPQPLAASLLPFFPGAGGGGEGPRAHLQANRSAASLPCCPLDVLSGCLCQEAAAVWVPGCVCLVLCVWL